MKPGWGMGVWGGGSEGRVVGDDAGLMLAGPTCSLDSEGRAKPLKRFKSRRVIS